SYTDNNPVSRVDHDGAFWISAGKFAGRYIGKGLKYGWKVLKRNYYRMKRPRKKPFVPNSYWSRKASHHSTPGSQHYHNRFYKGRWEKSKVIYDKFGRQRY